MVNKNKKATYFFYSLYYKFDTSDKNIKYNKYKNIVFLIQINFMDFFICFNPILTTHFRALNAGVFKTYQDSGSSGFINEYFVYEVFCQENKNYLMSRVNCIIFLYSKLKYLPID